MKDIIQLDFVDRSHRLNWSGVALLLLGVISSAAVLYEYHLFTQQRAGLEYRLTALQRARNPPQPPAAAERDAKLSISAQQAAADLATPWTLLLAELEQASKDSQDQVALLGVEPDHAKHSVRVTAEARTLELALRYVARLQNSHSLEYPMLERHEVRADDAQRPVRFELSGLWKDSL